MWQAYDDEAKWCRDQLGIIEKENAITLEQALALAEKLEQEGTISTAALAIRTLAKALKEVKNDESERSN